VASTELSEQSAGCYFAEEPRTEVHVGTLPAELWRSSFVHPLVQWDGLLEAEAEAVAVAVAVAADFVAGPSLLPSELETAGLMSHLREHASSLNFAMDYYCLVVLLVQPCSSSSSSSERWSPWYIVGNHGKHRSSLG